MSLGALRLVLDTNVVLDCLVFRDSGVRALMAALESRTAQPLVHQFSLDELKHVLAYPQCRLDLVEQRQVFDRYVALASWPCTPEGFSRDALELPTGFPRCLDADDQPFLALAYHAHADALVTKDKALLTLAKKAQKFGLTIRAPGEIVLQ